MSGAVQIGDSQRSLEDATQQWVTEQITRRRRAGEAVCIRVKIKKDNVDVALASGDCPDGRGGGRRPTRDETAMISEWNRRGLGGTDIPPGQLIAFLNHVC